MVNKRYEDLRTKESGPGGEDVGVTVVVFEVERITFAVKVHITKQTPRGPNGMPNLARL